MRGARDRQAQILAGGWIIPADAGSTFMAVIAAVIDRDHPRGCGSTVQPPPSKETFEDHPRGCGEHPLSSVVRLAEPGSSPRMRGAQPRSTYDIPKSRIIPADAGSTLQIQAVRKT